MLLWICVLRFASLFLIQPFQIIGLYVLDDQIFRANLLLEAWNEHWIQTRSICRTISLSILQARGPEIEQRSEK